MSSHFEPEGRKSLIPGSRTPPDTPNPSPIYSSLAAEWRALGKTLPGQFDTEWNDAVSRDLWPWQE
ncbi:hypothetical protein [Streptomyces sp. VRA16 Mangrove soil]|uniref:hypothetical protein n=1 Tax=Streptomyces sp. VRA16 Mangrove soil TaxID=2817434 RepID=UPI001A9F93BF|nr:hypothetical protein [Streptomyces sp. VRA16 Mangrove soil]MBO1337411.1 hypothetical protein [Streptomyces sp. VRA16 Mangrove soil]